MTERDRFEDKAKDWDERPVPVQISQAVGALLHERVAWTPEMKVMDFGAGTGLVASHIAQHVDRVVAVDVSPAMLDALAKKPELEGKVETRCQDIVEEPLGESFDAVVSAMALHHVEDTAAAVKRFHEHLKPGGQLALADLDAEDGSFHPPGTDGVFHHGFERGSLQRTLEAAGFESVHFETAVEIEKDGGSTYPIFLVTARRSS